MKMTNLLIVLTCQPVFDTNCPQKYMFYSCHICKLCRILPPRNLKKNFFFFWLGGGGEWKFHEGEVGTVLIT